MGDRILLVDDDQSVVRALLRHIRRDYDVHVAYDGKMALEVMEQHCFAVVLSDLRMPGMSGAEFIEQAQRKWPDTQYLVLTGNQESDEDPPTDAQFSGVREILRKPCTMQVLRTAIEAACAAYTESASQQVLAGDVQPTTEYEC
ncbi:response regulator [Aeoliella sp.]|uniref:response regulator n=1 Tax=Aeoliella sp. TaxID=2795800 RepID=UPI003CCBD813